MAFSLILHALLLFFVKLAPPSWRDSASSTFPLNVILDNTPAKVAKKSHIVAATRDSHGSAKIGVQENNRFTEKPLTVAKPTPVKQPKTEIPKVVAGKEILVVKKSDQMAAVQNLPDLLVKEKPEPTKPDVVEETYAPAPSVAKPVVAAPLPPIEDLVSVETASGVRQDRIVYAEPVQGNPLTEKPGNIPEELKPVKVEEPSPVKIEEPKPVKIDEPKPVEAEQAKPLDLENPEPVKIEEPKPAKVEEPVPVKVEEPIPAKVAEPVPVKVAEPTPVKIDEPASIRAEETSAAKSDVSAETGSGESGDSAVSEAGAAASSFPGLAELSIESVRKFANDNDRKIKFGERRKTVTASEQDFRYSMYVESVRLKLQRIGRFNFPAAAAMDNLSGTLSVIISIRADGSLEDFTIIRPSEYEVLDKGAENIVRMAAPFSPLPDSIRKETDVLSIKINWFFSKSSQVFN